MYGHHQPAATTQPCLRTTRLRGLDLGGLLQSVDELFDPLSVHALGRRAADWEQVQPSLMLGRPGPSTASVAVDWSTPLTLRAWKPISRAWSTLPAPVIEENDVVITAPGHR